MAVFEFYTIQVCPVIYATPVSRTHLDSMKRQARETTALYHLTSERKHSFTVLWGTLSMQGTGGTSELFKAIFIKVFLS